MSTSMTSDTTKAGTGKALPSATGNENVDMQPRVQIVGAGIAGLSLASHLRLQRIPFKIFDGASKPKGHNYGITIWPWGYTDLLPAMESTASTEQLAKAVAVDRSVDGKGSVSSKSDEGSMRVADSALRDLLVQNHDVHWNHRVTGTESTSDGLKLNFEDGTTSTASITIDAGGERSGLLSILLEDLKPEVIPYAVYHGSRYITLPDFDSQYADLFEPDTNVRELSLPYQPSHPNAAKTTFHIQLSRSYVPFSSLPSPVRRKLSADSSPDPETPMLELRYTISRPALDTQPDPLYNPTRSAQEAKTIPPTLYTELTSLLSQSSQSQSLPTSLPTLLSPTSIAENDDRVLNWLLRLKSPSTDDLTSLASKRVLLIGDSLQSLPILGSQGACQAMVDAKRVAEFLERKLNGGDGEVDVRDFYETMDWSSVAGKREERAREWLKERHGQTQVQGSPSGDAKL